LASATKNSQKPKPKVKIPPGFLTALLLVAVAGVAFFAGRRIDSVPVSGELIARAQGGASGVVLPQMDTMVRTSHPAAPVPAPVPGENSRKLRGLLADAKKALAAGQMDRAEQAAEEALRADPESRSAKDLKADVEEQRRQAERKERDRKVAAHQKEGLKALDRSDLNKALELLQAAQQLDPSNDKTFQLMERAYKLRDEQESKARREVFRKGQGVSSPRPAAPPQPGPVEKPVPAPKQEQVEPWEQEYTVQPEDVLQITVFEEPDLTTKTRVSRSGQIVFPMLGQVPVMGLTVSQVQEKLTELLGKEYLVHPQVQVFVDKPRNVFVTGQVHKPGSYPVSTEKPTTVMEIVAMAGGFTEEADLNGTRIIRKHHGEKQTIRVRITDIIRKGDTEKDETVRPDDIIFVPESFF